MTMTTHSKSKKFKTISGLDITCTVKQECVQMECNGYIAKYGHYRVNELLELHDKILSDRTMKEIRKFINESREPEQISLF